MMEKIESFKYREPEAGLWKIILNLRACIQRQRIEVSQIWQHTVCLHEVNNDGL